MALLSKTDSEVWRKQVLDSTHPISVMRSPLSGTDALSNLNLLDDTNNDLLKAEDNSITIHSIQNELCEQGFEVIVSSNHTMQIQLTTSHPIWFFQVTTTVY